VKQMAKIERLTAEQERRLVEWKREWFAIGSSSAGRNIRTEAR
jgi:hypothetical protein